jgi:PAS domain S-box-containing protein
MTQPLPPPHPQTRVLIVEDDAAAAGVLEAFLRAGQYQHVGTVGTGRAAIDLAQSSRPHLVIMDIVLPGDLDGIQTANLIREQFDVPVLYLTGYTDETLFERARVTAPFAYLTKPCDERDLKRAIEVALDRHALLQRIKASEAHMIEAQRVAHFGSWNWDLARDHIEASDELLRLAGMRRGTFEPCLDSFLQPVAVEDRPIMLRAIEALLRGEDPGDIDVRVPLPADGPRVLRLRGFVHFDADGKAFELVGTALDVTAEVRTRQAAETAHAELEARVAERTAELRAANARMQAEIDERLRMEESLWASEERYRGLIDNLPDAVLVLQDEQVVFANPAAARLFALPAPTTLLGVRPDALVHPDYQQICKQCQQAAAAGQAGKTPIAMKMLRGDGSSADVEVLTFAFSFEGQQAVLAVMHDLTYRRQMERAAERFRVALDSLPDAVLLIDPTAMRFIDVNETAMRALGYSRAELLAMGPQDVKPHFNKSMLRQRFAEVMAGAAGADIVQAVHRRKDGSTFPAEVRLRAFTSEAQPLLVAVVSDISQRQLAEAQLREANERFQQLAENVSEVFWILDLASNAFLYVSPAYEKLFGKSVASMYRHPRSFLSQVHPDDHHRVAAAFELQQRTLQGVELEYRIVLANHEVRWIWVRTFPIRDSAGKVYRMAGIAEDVTQRRASEEQMRNIIQTSMDGFWVNDSQGRLLDCNEACCRTLGYTREEMLGLSVSDLDAVETPAEAVAHIRRTMQQGRDRFETLHRRKDGQVVDIEASVYFQPDVEGGRFHVFMRDITERKRAEAALRESEARFRLLFEHAPIGIALAGPDRSFIQVNRALCDMLGYREAELLGKSFVDVTYPDDVAPNLDVFNCSYTGEITGYQLIKRYLHRNGGVVWTSLTTNVIRDISGAPLYSVGMVENITERVNAEAVRLAHEASLREALVREVHHRIKNNLHGVIGLMRQHIADHPEMQVPIEAAITQINAISVVHGLQSRMPQKELCLRELLPEICNAAAALAMQPKFAPIEDALRADIWLDSNASVSIALVLNELIQNALKHGAQQDSAEIGIGLAGDADQAVIRISNPGAALPPDFDFAAGKGYGTGLGLVRTLLPRHGASLDIACDGAQVCAELVLSPPVISRLNAGSKPAKEFT